MSIRVMSLVWDNFNRGGSEKLVMLAMADWCNDKGGSLHPSVSTVAKKTNISECQARRILHKFIDEGYLTVVGNEFGGSTGHSRQYQFNINKLATPSTDATPVVDATPSADAHLPLAPMHVTPSTSATQTTIEPSIEPPIYNAHDETSVFNGISKQIVDDYLQLRKFKKAVKFSQTAFDGLKRESDKAGINLEQALKICCERNWISIKASWLEEKQTYAESNTSAALTIFKPQYIAEQTGSFFANHKELTNETA